jgi:DNA-binding transcriptional MerR regulator
MLNVLEIPNKSHFRLNEVCSLTGVKPYVLRFWESEFDDIAPEISGSGEKLFSPGDIEAIAIIKELLFTKKMNIEEAKATMLRNAILEPESEVMSSGESDVVSSPQIKRPVLEDIDLMNLARAKSLLKEITLFS